MSTEMTLASEPAEAAVLREWVARRGERIDDIVITHISVIALTTERAYKMKRPVHFAFSDLSTPELRAAACVRELELNRRLAPDVYLHVEPVRDASGNVVDHVVVMRRLAAAHRLAVIARKGGGADCVARVAERLAEFHSSAPRRAQIDATATRDAIAALWREGFAQWRDFKGSVLDGPMADRIEALVERYLAGRARVFDERIAGRRILDGHGDLLADDIYCEPTGPCILDCLEFDDRLRYGDALADAAFLAMDLERLGRSDLATAFLRHVEHLESDAWPSSLEHHYVAYRAHVRAKVACLRHADRGDAASATEATALLALAHRHLERARVRIVVVGGLPGTGKSTLAARVATAIDAEHVRSDVVRKTLAGVPLAEHHGDAFRAGLYGDTMTAATYAALLQMARHHVERGRSVVLDATWADVAHRDEVATLATATASDVAALECRSPRAEVAARLALRARAGTDASDADLAVYDAMVTRFAAWPQARAIDTSVDANAAFAEAMRAL